MKLLLISIFLVVLLASSAFCLTPQDNLVIGALDAYYSAFQSEDLDDYYSTQNLSHLPTEDIEWRKEVTQSLWENLDTVSYSFDLKSTEFDGDYAFAEYILTSRIKGLNSSGTEESLDSQRQVVALLYKEQDWKVMQVMSADAFYNLFKDVYLDTQIDLIEEINEESLAKFKLKEKGSNELLGIEDSTGSTEKTPDSGNVFGLLAGLGIIGLGAIAFAGLALIVLILFVVFFFLKK